LKETVEPTETSFAAPADIAVSGLSRQCTATCGAEGTRVLQSAARFGEPAASLDHPDAAIASIASAAGKRSLEPWGGPVVVIDAANRRCAPPAGGARRIGLGTGPLEADGRRFDDYCQRRFSVWQTAS
jgi:hypothetical protein